MRKTARLAAYIWFFVLTVNFAGAQNPRADGYKAIWFTLGQFYDYGDKYSGGLGTYTADHIPVAVYSPAAKKTFFTYGGTTGADKRHLLVMISYYDHVTHTVPRPVIVCDKDGVDDPHDNGVLTIDSQGYIWVFVSGRMRYRPGFIFRSTKPYSIDSFEKIREDEMTYPQPWWIKGKGFLYLLTKYTNGRELYWTTSPDGKNWAPDQKLAGLGGHYQVTNMYGERLVSVFNYHPGGDVDKRTNIYAVQTSDMGKTWKTIDGKVINTPLSDVHNEALVHDYEAEHKLVYINDLNFDSKGNPVILAIISRYFKPGPGGDPREWMIIHWKNNRWNYHKVCESTHNYDMGSLYIEKGRWRIIGPTEPGPQYFGTGGEIAIWESSDEGVTWTKIKNLTSGSTRNNSYVRRPLNPDDDFYAYWADGDADKLSESHLYFSDKDGDNVRELPYSMSADNAIPLERKADGSLHTANDNKTTSVAGLPSSVNVLTEGYPVPENSIKSEMFSLKANGKDVFTQRYKDYHYAHIITARAFTLSVTCSEVIADIRISPGKFGIRAVPGKPSVSFVVPGPGYYVVRVNQKYKLFIFAESPGNEQSVSQVDITSQGVKSSSMELQTSAIQSAINSISGTGKTLFFPAGIYKTGSLSIPSNTAIYLDAGAVIMASNDLKDLDFRDNTRPKCFIRIMDAENVRINGPGVIDGNGRVLRDKFGDDARMRLILVISSRNVTVEEIFMRDPGSWNTHILNSEDIVFRNVKLLNDIQLSNTDGFDPDASRNVTIEKCFAYCSDDNVAVKITGSSGYLQNTSGINVRECVFLTKKSSLKVGTESRGDAMSNILFENNTVVESDRGMSLYCYDGALFDNIRFINNDFEDNYPDAKQSCMNFSIQKRDAGSKPGNMTNILIKDCSFDHPFPKSSDIGGLDEKHRISVIFDNLQVAGVKCLSEKDAGIRSNDFADINFK